MDVYLGGNPIRGAIMVKMEHLCLRTNQALCMASPMEVCSDTLHRKIIF